MTADHDSSAPAAQPTVPLELVRAHLVAAAAVGLDLDAVATRAGCAGVFARSDEYRIPIDAFARLIRLTWDTLGSETAGFTEQPQRPGLFAMMCHATITCPNLRRALLRAARFYSLVQDEIAIELVEHGDEAQLRFAHRNRRGLDDRAFIESLMVIWVRWSSWLIQRELLPDRIQFAFAPGSYREEYARMFPCDHYFGARENCVVFPARYLDHPVTRDSAELAEFLNSAPESLMRRYIESPTLSSTVRRMLRRRDDIAGAGVEEIAALLGISAQTLRRRLREEGNGFQEIKDSVRKESAIDQLLNSARTANEIAESIGFSEPSAFHRAFRKGTGTTPGAYRDAAQRR
ncbi:MAG: AraC family transcriptional regulator [Gammaproteobacteria bacterium]|nr:AraC family transcriptional regulator [Gammaproteobacteria bacterium]